MEIITSEAITGVTGDTLRPRFRNTWSLILVRFGTAHGFVETEDFIVSNGSILIIPPDTDLCIDVLEEYEHIVVEWSEQILPGSDGFVRISDDPEETATTILLVLAKQFIHRPVNNRQISSALTDALRQFLWSRVAQKPPTDIQKLEEALRRNMSNPSFQITDALKKIPQAPSYSRKLFQQFFGCSPKAYLTRLRISPAKVLLISQHNQISEIAAKCGFSDAKSFTHCFHKETGTSPTEFKKIAARTRI